MFVKSNSPHSIFVEFSAWWWFQQIIFTPKFWGFMIQFDDCAYFSDRWKKNTNQIQRLKSQMFHSSILWVSPRFLQFFHGFPKGSKAINSQKFDPIFDGSLRLGLRRGKVETHPLWVFPSFLVSAIVPNVSC